MSDISTRKIRTFFRRFDLNRDGTLTRAEFLSMGDGLADMEKFDPKQRETFHEHLDNVSIMSRGLLVIVIVQTPNV